jgi:hypothetical protein
MPVATMTPFSLMSTWYSLLPEAAGLARPVEL